MQHATSAWDGGGGSSTSSSADRWQQWRKRTTSVEILATIQDDLGRLSFPSLEHADGSSTSLHHDPLDHTISSAASTVSTTASVTAATNTPANDNLLCNMSKSMLQQEINNQKPPTFISKTKKQQQPMATTSSSSSVTPSLKTKKPQPSFYPSVYQIDSSMLTAPDISLDQLFQQAQAASALASQSSNNAATSSSRGGQHNRRLSRAAGASPENRYERLLSSSCPEFSFGSDDRADAAVAALLQDAPNHESSSSSPEQSTPQAATRGLEASLAVPSLQEQPQRQPSAQITPRRPPIVGRAQSAHTPTTTSSSQRQAPPPPAEYWSGSSGSHRQRATQPSVQHERPLVEIEVAPGVYKTLRRSDETVSALERGEHAVVTCFACNVELGTVADCELVICPDCRVLSPMVTNHDDDPSGSSGENEYYGSSSGGGEKSGWGNASMPSLSPSSCTGDASSVWSLSDRDEDDNKFSSPPLSPLQGERICMSSSISQVHLQPQRNKVVRLQQPQSNNNHTMVRYGIGLGVKMQ